MTPNFLTLSGRQLAYERTDGQTGKASVIFCGGFASDMTGTKASFLADYCSTCNISFLRFDYSGHGKSSGDFKEGTIGARFNTTVTRITDTDVILNGPGGEVRERADAVLLLTGFRSDPVLLRSVGAAIDPDTGAPVHNEETFETNVPGVFVIGAFVAGKQSGRIFIENGRFHGEVVVKEIARRLGNGDSSNR